MSLFIGDTAMTSDQSTHTARQMPGPSRGWEVSWLPDRTFDRNTAITAMSLAAIAATGDIRPGDRLWPVVESWSAEVGLTGPDAISRASQPQSGISRQHEPASNQPDLEAGQPASLAELLETGRTRARDPEPDLEAEP